MHSVFSLTCFRPLTIALLVLGLTACGSDDYVSQNSESLANSSVQINLSPNTPTRTKAAGDNLLDLNGNWPQWNGQDSGIFYDPAIRALRIPGNGSNYVMGVRRVEQPLTAFVEYTLQLQSSSNDVLAVIFPFDQNGDVVAIPHQTRRSNFLFATRTSPLTFTAPTGISGFYVQVQNTFQATTEATASPQVIEGAAVEGPPDDRNLIDGIAPWLTWDGQPTGITGAGGSFSIPKPTNGAAQTIGVRRYQQSLMPGATYSWETIVPTSGGTAALLFLFDADYRLIPFPTGANWLTAPFQGSIEFVAPPGVASFAVQIQDAYFSDSTSTVITPALRLQSGGNNPQPSACNVIENPGFENGASQLAGDAATELTDIANSGARALEMRNGWVGTSIETDSAFIFSGYFRVSATGTPGFVGINYYDENNNELGGSFRPLTVSPDRYELFSIRVTNPPVAMRRATVWIYSEADVLLDDLVLRRDSCVE